MSKDWEARWGAAKILNDVLAVPEIIQLYANCKRKHILQYKNAIPRAQHVHNDIKLRRFDKELRDSGPCDAIHNGQSGRAAVLKAPALCTLICG